MIFNTSPVLLTPLTDDYEYVKDQLDLIAQCLKSRNEVNLDDAFSSGYDWIYYQAYISSGTLIGNEQRGSSLIGDGLAAAAIDFSDASARSHLKRHRPQCLPRLHLLQILLKPLIFISWLVYTNIN